MQVCCGNVGLMPIMFFVVTSALSSLGPGNIASAALVALVAMAVCRPGGGADVSHGHHGRQWRKRRIVLALAPAGIVVNGIMNRIGLGGHESLTYLNNLLVHAVVAIVAYFILGGWKLFRFTYTVPPEESSRAASLDAKNWITLGVIAALIVSVIWFKVDVGMGAFLGASLLTALGLADHKESIKRVPWGVIIMVCGVTVLISILEKTQGLDLFTALLARLATKDTITGVIAFVTGLVSVYSSTSGVVLPAFLPTIPGLVERLGGGDPIAIASSMNIGGHIVDVSPLSTIGALCIAAIPVTEDPKALFAADDLGAVDDGRRRHRLLRVVRSVGHPRRQRAFTATSA